MFSASYDWAGIQDAWLESHEPLRGEFRDVHLNYNQEALLQIP
jgi:hypothetical protein